MKNPIQIFGRAALEWLDRDDRVERFAENTVGLVLTAVGLFVACVVIVELLVVVGALR